MYGVELAAGGTNIAPVSVAEVLRLAGGNVAGGTVKHLNRQDAKLGISGMAAAGVPSGGIHQVESIRQAVKFAHKTAQVER